MADSFGCHNEKRRILTSSLSWSDTTASTLGRLWGRYTPPLPAHVPGIKFLPFAPRKSLAGFLAATITGILICLGFWRNGSGGHWHLLDAHWLGLLVSSVVIGVGGAVVEALGELVGAESWGIARSFPD